VQMHASESVTHMRKADVFTAPDVQCASNRPYTKIRSPATSSGIMAGNTEPKVIHIFENTFNHSDSVSYRSCNQNVGRAAAAAQPLVLNLALYKRTAATRVHVERVRMP
jgi:hypothetical protein